MITSTSRGRRGHLSLRSHSSCRFKISLVKTSSSSGKFKEGPKDQRHSSEYDERDKDVADYSLV